MSIYHCQTKCISRSTGRTASGSAAYRACEKIKDAHTGELHDYTKKKGLLYKELVLPDDFPTWALDRESLWNEADKKDNRKNSTVSREYELALPNEISQSEREKLVRTFAKYIVSEYGVAADIAIHDQYRNNGNYHAHVMTSTRVLRQDGFGEKTRILDSIKTGSTEIIKIRLAWEKYVNQALEQNGINQRVSCESLKAQGIDREPQIHVGVAASAMARKGIRTERADLNDAIKINNAAKAKALKEEQERLAAEQLAREIAEARERAKKLEEEEIRVKAELARAEKSRLEAEAKAREAEERARAEAEARRKSEVAAAAQRETERRAKEEQERVAAEEKAKAAREAKARAEEAEERARAEELARREAEAVAAQREADRREKEEQERAAAAEAERKLRSTVTTPPISHKPKMTYTEADNILFAARGNIEYTLINKLIEDIDNDNESIKMKKAYNDAEQKYKNIRNQEPKKQGLFSFGFKNKYDKWEKESKEASYLFDDVKKQYEEFKQEQEIDFQSRKKAIYKQAFEQAMKENPEAAEVYEIEQERLAAEERAEQSTSTAVAANINKEQPAAIRQTVASMGDQKNDKIFVPGEQVEFIPLDSNLSSIKGIIHSIDQSERVVNLIVDRKIWPIKMDMGKFVPNTLNPEIRRNRRIAELDKKLNNPPYWIGSAGYPEDEAAKDARELLKLSAEKNQDNGMNKEQAHEAAIKQHPVIQNIFDKLSKSRGR